ncbi:MAG: hypothetical protein WC059_02695 [Candidatus Paceibacterota bacterium]
MKNTHQVLEEIAEINPSITHFLLRIYKHTIGSIHDPVDGADYQWVKVSLLNKIESIINTFENDGWSVGLVNTVMTNRGMKYLPVLDYKIEQSEENLKRIVERLTIFDTSGDVEYSLKGYIIQTNNSYHFLGKYITTEENFINFLGSSLLFRHSGDSSFVVDDRWLGYSLKRKFATLRIGKKGGAVPFVIQELK